ncbi:Ni/Fe-hydrogenase 1 b-type cytochrome subunit [Novosphingobium barchaimii LL02]|uniref:Ni/Fe-hydrogenase 1 b-type cytochrome subunit n=1 Tax=Novosphingobium barchaimii LL02 TaxID=1114963 RepID=A0A0J7XT26_9SPHN|nr:cytochrome b/b6 domain-containing protein [Novosphingobium barchaimii]KMS54822.1 Ni/Fe-hydrogenase 1 b-type cytochrome subunit [Novosphingobium barchaimii LL02]
MPAASTTRIWDPAVRLFHWLLVALIAFSWWSGEQHDMERHRLSGYAILALLVFRVFWGFAGPRTARFSSFVRGPGAVIAYMKGLGRRAGHAADGHNPLGGWSVIAMLAVIGLMVTAGLFAVDVDGFQSGPLADYVSFDQGRTAAELHETLFNAILALVALHVAAVAFYLVWKRQNLVRPMITGSRKTPDGERPAELRWSPALAVLGIAIAVAVAWTVSTGFRF